MLTPNCLFERKQRKFQEMVIEICEHTKYDKVMYISPTILK